MATSLDVDALIVGGGPAGSACAIRLAQSGVRTAILEASDFSRFRIGEIVDASVRHQLHQLKIDFFGKANWGNFCSGVIAAWGQHTVTRRPSIINPYGRGWRVERSRFDRMLFDHASEAGATTMVECRLRSAERRSGFWEFTIETTKGKKEGRAGWIIAATGRSARAPAAPNGTRRWLDRLVAFASTEELKQRESTNLSDGALVEATDDGWWYSVGLSHNRRLTVFFTDPDLLPSGRANIAKFLREQLMRSVHTKASGRLVEDGNRPSRWKGFDARSGIRQVVVSEGWVAIGDAAMAFDPLCGRGVVEALKSGIDVGEWLVQSCPLEDDGLPAWAHQAAARFNVYCNQRVTAYAAETRWVRSPFWQRRQRRLGPLN